ncbi:hypothetical protein [Streptomyces abyssomicinicus]|uniref:hypothetical protein n=1 Tax=Streptomyces abyssomicinicus TaxID=574929 RepID=UPI001FED09FF|nr:hypothetical protein [Streptomyces abyssomicinicus]
MAITDHHDVFVGATADGYTFALLNRPLRAGPRLLTDAGFTAHGHGGRTAYLFAPSTGQEAHTRAGDALADLLEHTLDIVDLAWTTRWHPAGRPAPDVRFRFSHSAMTATAETSNGQSLLAAEGYTLSTDQTFGCGAVREPATRDTEGRPLCPNCMIRQPENLEECVGCGRRKPVASRLPEMAHAARTADRGIPRSAVSAGERLSATSVWHHVRRLRRRLGEDHTTRLQDLNVRCHVTAANNFLDWLGGEGLAIGTCTQTDLERWMADPTVSYPDETGHFVRWSVQHRHAAT